MKTVIKTIVFLLVGITVAFYGGAYMLPGEARVERSIEIAAPPAKVYAIAADLRRFPDWSPWRDTDPATTFSVTGPEQGAGQVLRWASGNPMVGSGTLTLTEAVPDERVATRSEYPNFGTSDAVMRFAPAGTGTRVTWTFSSTLPGVIDRWAGLGLGRAVGDEYAKGLDRLKALAENS